MHEPSTTLICGIAGGAHARLVVEDAAEVVAVGEDLGLQRQERAAGVHEVEAGQAVLGRDLLRAQVLLHREREVGAALHGGVVGHDHDLAAAHAADAGDEAGRGRGAVVEAVGGEGADLEEGRPGIEQALDALADQELALLAVAAHRLVAAALAHRREPGPQVRDQPVHVRLVLAELGGRRVDVALDHGHSGEYATAGRPEPQANS